MSIYTNERICRKCKGIINLDTHAYYVSKSSRRICLNCIEWQITDEYRVTDNELIQDCIKYDFNFINKK